MLKLGIFTHSESTSESVCETVVNAFVILHLTATTWVRPDCNERRLAALIKWGCVYGATSKNRRQVRTETLEAIEERTRISHKLL